MVKPNTKQMDGYTYLFEQSVRNFCVFWNYILRFRFSTVNSLESKYCNLICYQVDLISLGILHWTSVTNWKRHGTSIPSIRPHIHVQLKWPIEKNTHCLDENICDIDISLNGIQYWNQVSNPKLTENVWARNQQRDYCWPVAKAPVAHFTNMV